MPSYAFLCGVEHSSLLGWSVSGTGWAMRLHAVFMQSFSRDCNHAGYAVIGSVNRSVPWLTPILLGLIRNWSGMRSTQSHRPLKSTSGTQTLSPTLILCPCNVWTTFPPPHHENKRGKQVLEVGNTWGMRTSRGKYLRDKNFMGNHGHFLWLTPHWGSQEDCLACIGYRELHRVIRP